MNCVHMNVCQKFQIGMTKDCKCHIYDASPQRYGDFQELIEPIYKWLKIHYPNEAKLLIDYDSCELLINHRSYFSERIRGKTLTEAFKENLNGN